MNQQISEGMPPVVPEMAAVAATAAAEERQPPTIDDSPAHFEEKAAAFLGSSGQAEDLPDALGDLAALLAEQLSACHAAASRCFAIANDEEDFQLPVRLDALKLAARLVQASATAASAVKRIKGGEFHHRVTVSHIDYPAEKAARKAREEAARGDSGMGERVRAKIRRVIEQARNKLTPEERDTIDRIWEEAERRSAPPGPGSPGREDAA
jgi:hypothetical protein